MAIFVSSQAVDEAPASTLIAGLRSAGVVVEHSPSNPEHRDDGRWSDWYGKGLPNTLVRCSIFIAVVDRGWDSSTWMAIEADLAGKKLGAGRIRSVFWNPEARVVTAKGMLPYLEEELPRDLSRAISWLREADCHGVPA
jgi:hypothetical protein